MRYTLSLQSSVFLGLTLTDNLLEPAHLAKAGLHAPSSGRETSRSLLGLAGQPSGFMRDIVALKPPHPAAQGGAVFLFSGFRRHLASGIPCIFGLAVLDQPRHGKTQAIIAWILARAALVGHSAPSCWAFLQGETARRTGAGPVFDPSI